MPMMRRGPLDRYPPEWVLRQANAHAVEGSIEFHTDRPVTLYLQGGRTYAAEEGVNLIEQDLADRHLADERGARAQVVGLLTDVLAAGAGWYFHDPLGQHPSRGSWTWETAALLMESRVQAHETTSLEPWAGRTVVLHETPAESITLGPDAWAVVVRLAGSASASELRAQLGWSPDRIAGALAEIEDRGVLEPSPSWQRPAEPAERPHHPSPPPPPPVTAPGQHHTGPLAPPPAIEDADSRRRRRLPSRRSTRT